jgi:hypothetical protein
MCKNNLTSQKYSRVILIELIAECPLGGNPKDCPLYERRKLSMEEKTDWVNSLTDDECRTICLTHCECLQKKASEV